jgi:hypothetical protein
MKGRGKRTFVSVLLVLGVLVTFKAIFATRAGHGPTTFSEPKPSSAPKPDDDEAAQALVRLQAEEPFTFDVPKGWIKEHTGRNRPFQIYRPPTNEIVALVVSPLVPIGTHSVRDLASVPSTRDLLINLAEWELGRSSTRRVLSRGEIVPFKNAKWPDLALYHQTYSDVLDSEIGEVEENVDCFGVERNHLARVLCIHVIPDPRAREVARAARTALLNSIRPTSGSSL